MKYSLRRVLAWMMMVMMLLTAMPTNALAAIIETSGSVQPGVDLLGLVEPTEGIYVTFKFMNGEEVVSTQVLKNGDTVATPATPAAPEEGARFDGWYVGEEKFDFTQRVNYEKETTVTVEAKFTEVHYVYFLDVEGKVYATGVATEDNGYKVTPPNDYRPADGQVTGWLIQGTNTAFTADTVVTGDTYVTPVTTEGYWVTFSTQGAIAGVDSQFVPKGGSITLSNVPERTGYEFNGWNTAADGTGDSYARNASFTPSVSTILYAQWKPARVNYTVVYWGENANDEKFGTLLDSRTLTAYTDSVVEASATTHALRDSVTNRSYFSYDTAANAGNSVKIAADGSSVLNVYFSRNEYTVTFNILGYYGTGGSYNNRASSNTYSTKPVMTINGRTYNESYTLKAKFEQDIEDLWPTASNVTTNPVRTTTDWWDQKQETTYQFYGWNSSKTTTISVSKRLTLTSDLIGASMTALWTTDMRYYELHYMFESLDETGDKYGNRYYNESPEYSQFAYAVKSDNGWSAKKITGLTNVTVVEEDSKNGDDDYDVYLYYTRNSYTFTQNNYGTEHVSRSLKYGASISGYNTTPDRPEGFSENASFKGWYTVEPGQITEGTQPFDFTNATMPAGNLILYAYWVEEDITVNINVKVSDSESFTREVTVPAGTSIPETDAYGDALNYIAEKGLTLLRWEDANGDDIDLNQELYEDRTIYAIFDTGAHTVTYLPGEGGVGEAVKDSNAYHADALARVQECAFPAKQEGYAFIYWTDAEGNIYYPGSYVTIDNEDVVLTANYVPEDQLISITYDGNGGALADGATTVTVESLVTNDTYTIADNAAIGFALAGYSFVGWTTAKDGSGNVYQGGETVRLTAEGANILYAQWKQTSYKLTLEKVAEPATTKDGEYTKGVVDGETFTLNWSYSLPVEGAEPQTGSGSATATWSEENGAFTYQNNVVLIPAGATVTISEDSLDNWTPSYAATGADMSGNSFTMPEGAVTATVTNARKVGRLAYNIVLSNASISTNGDLEYYRTTDSGGDIYVYTARNYSNGDTYTVIGREPTADGNVFIAWLDKAFGGSESAMKYPGGSGTYNRGNTVTGVQTLDAIWANINAEDKTVTYDGTAYGIDPAEIAFNQGSLDEEYMNQAKDHVKLQNVEYRLQSSENENEFSTTIPTFTEAGTYVIEVQGDVYVDGARKATLTTTATLKINPRPVTVTVKTDEIDYDGEPHTVAGETSYEYTIEAFNAETGRGIVSGHTEELNVVYGTDAAENKTLVGVYVATVAGGVKIFADAVDKTHNYAVEVKDGTLTIKGDNPIDTTKTVSGETPENGYKPGDTILFTIKVQNLTDETLTNVTVTDDTATLVADEGYTLEGNTATIEELRAGATVNVTAQHTVTESDIIVGEYTNTATVTVGDKTYNPTATVDKFVPVDGELTVTKSSKLPEGKTEVAAGDKIEYTITVKNTGNVTVKNIEVTDILSDAEGQVIGEIAELAPNSIKEFSFTYTVTEADIIAGQVYNQATAKGEIPNPTPENPDNTEPVSGSDEETNTTEEKKGELTVTKETISKPKEGNTYKLGETIEYKITVTNTGNVTITGIKVTDSLSDAEDKVIGEIESLAPNASEEFKFSHVVTQEDILNGKVVNEATATGRDPEDKEPEVTPGKTEDDPETPSSKLTVTKTTTSKPADGKAYKLGETIKYTITVTNDGNLTLENVTVEDTLEGAVIVAGEGYEVVNGKAVIGTLAPKKTSVPVYAEYVVTEADILKGTVTNAATATGTSPEEKEPEVTPGETTDDPEGLETTLTVEKVSYDDNGGEVELGDQISYTIRVTNDGNVPYTNVIVKDELEGLNILDSAAYSINADGDVEIPKLAVGETVNVYATYIVTEKDILAGEVKNVATAKADPIPDPKDPENPKTPEGEGEKTDPTEDKNGHLTIDKDTKSKPADGKAYKLGEKIEYTITVTNDGNLTITDIEVKDDLTGDSWKIAALEPYESETFTAVYTVTEEDVLKGSVQNVATATGESPDPDEPKVPVTPGEEDDPTETPNPSLFVDKTTTSKPANGTAYTFGETITYEITVLNNGNVTIRDIEVKDELTGDSWTIEALEPGEKSATFETSYTVTDADILAGSVKNVATASGTSTDPEKPDPIVTPGEEEEPTETPNPSFSIVKTVLNLPEKGYFTAGETAEFAITVTNDGNLSLTNLVIREQLAGATILPGAGYTTDGTSATIASLTPKGEVVISASYTITEADLGAELTNVVTGTADGPTDPTDPENPDKNDPSDETGEVVVPTDEAVNISGTKTWNDLDNLYGTRPEAITLRLMNGETELASAQATAATGWTYSFGPLPAHDAQGAAIDYSVVEDAVEGYEALYAADSDDITNELRSFTLTVRYWYETIGGAEAAPTVTRSYFYGESYDVASPAITGFTADQARVTGVITGDTELDVVYTRNSYNLTVRYVYQGGGTAAPTYRSTLAYDDDYRVTSPVLSGYIASRTVISGRMPGRDLVYTVIYVPENTEIIIDEYGVPLGIGNVEMNVGDCFE